MCVYINFNFNHSYLAFVVNFIIQLKRDVNRFFLLYFGKNPFKAKWPFSIDNLSHSLALPLSYGEVSITFHVRDKCLLIIFYCYFFIFNLIRRSFFLVLVFITISTMTLRSLSLTHSRYCHKYSEKVMKRKKFFLYFKMKFRSVSENLNGNELVCIVFFIGSHSSSHLISNRSEFNCLALFKAIRKQEKCSSNKH